MLLICTLITTVYKAQSPHVLLEVLQQALSARQASVPILFRRRPTDRLLSIAVKFIAIN